MLSKVISTNKRSGMFSFTFDDGVSKNFEQLLEILDEHNVKATFFIVGSTLQLQSNALLLKSAHEKGHTIGNHTWSHADITKLSNEDLVKEIVNTSNKIEEITGEKPKYFRPPYGAINEALGHKIIEMGYKILLWDIDNQDWNRKRSKEELLNLYKGSLATANSNKYSYINLQHDLRKESVELVPDIIKLASDKKFKIVGIDEYLS